MVFLVPAVTGYLSLASLAVGPGGERRGEGGEGEGRGGEGRGEGEKTSSSTLQSMNETISTNRQFSSKTLSSLQSLLSLLGSLKREGGVGTGSHGHKLMSTYFQAAEFLLCQSTFQFLHLLPLPIQLLLQTTLPT